MSRPPGASFIAGSEMPSKEGGVIDYVHVFVLTSLCLDMNGDVRSRNVAVTFDLFEAEDHRAKGIEHDYEVFVVAPDWREDAARSEFISAMRELREIVKQMHDEALRKEHNHADPGG